MSSLRLLPGEEEEIVPDNEARFLIAQGDSPERPATWTVRSAPTGADLKAGMAAIAQDARWQQLDGYAYKNLGMRADAYRLFEAFGETGQRDAIRALAEMRDVQNRRR